VIFVDAITVKEKLRLVVNGEEHILSVATNATLAEVLRERLGLTGLKVGCNNGECGACTVLVDGQPTVSCLTLAIDCEGKEILTIEGLANSRTGELHPIQEAFIEHHGFQCGFCTPGVIMSVKALLDQEPNPSEEEIKEAINGNICRCGSYISIIESVLAVAKKMGGN